VTSGDIPLTLTLDLRALDVSVGGAHTHTVRTAVEPLALGGQTYRCEPAEPELRFDAVRPLSGWHLRIRGAVELLGPCWRCLADARVAVTIDATEIDDPSADDLELVSAFIDRDQLDLSLWARDAVAEAMPPAIVCREDCAGLCPTCGIDFNEASCACTTTTTDPRWAALADVAARLKDD
jgi:uncharacterized protein